MTTADLEPLIAELARWRADGRRARLWLRDDDAIAATGRLEAMSAVLQRFSLRALLAVIPAQMDKGFAAAIAGLPCSPCQHGLRHFNHEPNDAPKAEFGATRQLADAIADIEQGQSLMRQAFGDRFVPIFVPPWNRIAKEVATRLPGLGFAGLSTYGDEPVAAVPDFIEVDAAIDILNWSEPEAHGVAVLPLAVLARRLAAMLHDRRNTPSQSAAAPIGVLTHHRAMSQTAWDTMTTIIAATLDSDAVDWADPLALFDLATEPKVSQSAAPALG